jgi:hypothetical protein
MNPGLAVGRLVGMNWFRSNVKQGSRLALFALALQFVLSFGHFHAGAAQAAALTVHSVAAQIDASSANVAAPDVMDRSAAGQQTPSNHDSDHPNDPCAICAVIALAGSVLSPASPHLLQPHAAEFSYLVTDAGFVHLSSAGVAFQPRAPPAS